MNVEQKNTLYTYKIVIIGAGGVGKTCLFNRFCFNSFNFDTIMTIGISFHSTHLKLNFHDSEEDDEEEYFVVDSIFDFGGQERFKPMIPQFLEGANGTLLVFDSVSYPSFEQLEYWYNKITTNADPNIPKLLIGSKSDLLESTPIGEIVREDIILDFLEEKQLDGFYRVSALTNFNVLEVFKELTNMILKYNNVPASIK